MKFERLRKLYKAKQKWSKIATTTWYKVIYPIAWALRLYDDFKYKRTEKKIANLTIQKVGELMAKRILEKLTINPKRVYEFYVCESSYYSDDDPVTIIDYMIYDLCYTKGKFALLYKWAYKQHYHYRMNDVWLTGVLTQVIYDELCSIEELDVHWEYVCQINEELEYIQPIKNYEKHLVVKVKK